MSEYQQNQERSIDKSSTDSKTDKTVKIMLPFYLKNYENFHCLYDINGTEMYEERHYSTYLSSPTFLIYIFIKL